MKRTQRPLTAALLFWLAAPAAFSQAFSLNLPPTARQSAERTESLTSYAVPTGPFANGSLPTRRAEGTLRQIAWRVDAPGATTLELLAPLRAQLVGAGFRTLLDCDSAECGGFDFRFATNVLPEPEMHVDLGDYRFFAAERGAEVVTLMVSRSSAAGFVQMIHVVGVATPASGAGVANVADPADAPFGPMVAGAGQSPAPAALPDASSASGLGARLLADGAVALDDLVFASGTSALAASEYPSLQALAELLRDKPDLTIAIVGHTDASGGLEGNIALSRKRADAARAVLIESYGVAASRVEARGIGFLAPRASNLTVAGREKNRRVEVIVTSTQ